MWRGDWLVLLAILVAVIVVYLVTRRGGREHLERRTLEEALAVRVRDVMSSPVIVAREDMTLEEAARTMLEAGIGCLPVVGRDGRLVGIVTGGDFSGTRTPFSILALGRPVMIGEWVRANGVERSFEEARGLPVADIMSRGVVTVTEDEPVTDLVLTMMERRLHHVPVVADGVPVGIVARHDLLRLMAPDVVPH